MEQQPVTEEINDILERRAGRSRGGRALSLTLSAVVHLAMAVAVAYPVFGLARNRQPLSAPGFVHLRMVTPGALGGGAEPAASEPPAAPDPTPPAAPRVVEKIPPRTLAHRAIHHLSAGDVKRLVRAVVEETAKVYDFNEAHRGNLEVGFDGQISTFMPYEGPCYRCLYPTPPPAELAPSCSANGVLGVMAGTMGTLQANEVIKLVLGKGSPLIGRLLLYDALGTTFTELKVRRDPDCPICGEHAPEIPESEMGQFPDYDLFCAGAGGDR